ncbi:type II toxin-antitoxin system Phd/YefM family antitoxin [Rhodocyclaceae bacterium SMB388]
MRTLTLAETKAHLSAVIDQVVEGEEIVITRRGRPVARIVPEREVPLSDVAHLVADLREFLLAQEPQPHPAAEVVRALRDGERY